MLIQVTTDMVKAAEALELNPGDVLTFDGTKWVAQPGVPSGTVLQFAGGTAPTGWLLCDWSAISRASYAGLFAALGTSYGAGNGTTTFNLPDLRGRVPVGLDNMGGTSANRITASQADVLGGNGGLESKALSGSVSLSGTVGDTTLSTSQLPSHDHIERAISTGSAANQGASNVTYYTGTTSGGSLSSTSLYQTSVALTTSLLWPPTTNDLKTATAGSSSSHSHSFSGSGSLAGSNLDVTQPWLALSYIIKA